MHMHNKPETIHTSVIPVSISRHRHSNRGRSTAGDRTGNTCSSRNKVHRTARTRGEPESSGSLTHEGHTTCALGSHCPQKGEGGGGGVDVCHQEPIRSSNLKLHIRPTSWCQLTPLPVPSPVSRAIPTCIAAVLRMAGGVVLIPSPWRSIKIIRAT